MKRLLLLLSVLSVIGLLWESVTPAHACTCQWVEPQQHVASADVILIGTIDQLVEDEVFNRQYGHVDLDASVAVERYVKGSGEDQVVVNDGNGGGDCGFIEESDVGRRYLFMLSRSDQFGLATSMCSGNAPLDPRNESYVAEIESISASRGADDDSASSNAGGDFPLPMAVGLAIGLPVAFLAGAAFLWRRGG